MFCCSTSFRSWRRRLTMSWQIYWAFSQLKKSELKSALDPSPPATSTLFKIPPCPVLFIQPIYSMLIKVTFFSHLYTYSVQRRFRINYFSIPRWSSYLYFCCCFFSVFMLKVYTYSTFNWNSKMYSMLLFHAVRPWKRASCFLVGRRNSTWIQKRWAQRMGDFFSWLI